MGNVSLSAGRKQQHEHWPTWSPLSPPREDISSQSAAKEVLQSNLQSNLQSEHSFWQSVKIFFFEEKQPATASLSQRENDRAPCCVGLLSYKSACMATMLKFQAKKWRGHVMRVYVSASTHVALCLSALNRTRPTATFIASGKPQRPQVSAALPCETESAETEKMVSSPSEDTAFLLHGVMKGLRGSRHCRELSVSS